MVGVHPFKFPGCVVESAVLGILVMLHAACLSHVPVTCTVLSLSVKRGPISCSERTAGHETAAAGADVARTCSFVRVPLTNWYLLSNGYQQRRRRQTELP